MSLKMLVGKTCAHRKTKNYITFSTNTELYLIQQESHLMYCSTFQLYHLHSTTNCPIHKQNNRSDQTETKDG